MADEIKALEEELKLVKQSLQALSSTKNQPQEVTATKKPSGKKSDKKKSSNSQEVHEDTDYGQFLREFKESYYDQSSHELERRRQQVALFLENARIERMRSKQQIAEQLQGDAKSRAEYLHAFKVTSLQDRIDRAKWLQHMKDSQSQTLSHFLEQFKSDCQNSRRQRAKDMASMKKALNSLLKRK